MHRLAAALAGFALIAAAPALAQEPPARVGRVSFVSGHLAFHMAGETQWSAAVVNYPVAAGSSFWTDPHSRAEIRIGAQTIDLDSNTQLDIKTLDEQVVQIAVPQGRINLHLRHLGQGNAVEIDIPRGGVWPLQSGVYDIDAGAPDRATRIAVFEGQARFVGGSVDVGIKAGDVAVITGAQTLTARLEHASPDAFTQWCRSRDYDEHRLASPYHVSPRMTGYEALDEYGTWRTVSQYGEVWYPSALPAGWVPYREGRWVWVEPWGWNWVDAEPWGFAPFHYGRWASIDGAWGWVPGAFVPRPVYAPALVTYISDPAAIVLSAAGAPLVGWFPLGPGEAYWPSYTTDPTYIEAINTGIVRDPAHLGPRPDGDPATAARAFANRMAATVVPRHAFGNAERISRAALRVSDPKARHARVTARGPAMRAALAHGGHGGPGAAAHAGRHGIAAHAAAAGHGGGRGAARHFAHGGAGHHGGAHFARGGGHHGGAHFARGGGHHGGGHFAHGGGHFAHGGAHFAHGGGHHGGGHFANGGGHHGGGHFAHGGGPHFGGGMPHGGGMHFGAGGGGHGGGGHGGGGHGGGGHGGGHGGGGHGGGGHGHGGGHH